MPVLFAILSSEKYKLCSYFLTCTARKAELYAIMGVRPKERARRCGDEGVSEGDVASLSETGEDCGGYTKDRERAGVLLRSGRGGGKERGESARLYLRAWLFSCDEGGDGRSSRAALQEERYLLEYKYFRRSRSWRGSLPICAWIAASAPISAPEPSGGQIQCPLIAARAERGLVHDHLFGRSLCDGSAREGQGGRRKELLRQARAADRPFFRRSGKGEREEKEKPLSV